MRPTAPPFHLSLLFAVLSHVPAAALASSSFPPPFTRDLSVQTPSLTGSDVFIACSLLQRDDSVTPYTCDSVFDPADASAVSSFNVVHGLCPAAAAAASECGVFTSASASLLLSLHSADGTTDSGFTARSLGYQYKLYLPVHANRSIETSGILFDGDNNELLSFVVRTHGHRDDGSAAPWPDFGDSDVGLSQFASDGNTVTGIVEVDLNSPEPDPDLYGPYPVNRVVRGLSGNAAVLLPDIRDGILVHTGNWTGWTSEDMDMPNSSGCVHAHPDSVRDIYEKLVSIGVQVRDNTFSGKNYPYKPQGIAVIELID